MNATNDAKVTIATGDPLDVRSFSVKQAMSELFSVELVVRTRNQDIDFDGVIGLPATFTMSNLLTHVPWTGICERMELVRTEEDGLATYRLVIVPRMWLLTQRTNYRIFQFKSEIDIVKQILGEWGVELEARIDREHKPRKYRTQYGESDYVFVRRMLEDAGTSFYFDLADGGTKVVLDDAPETRELSHPLLAFHDEPSVTDGLFVTKLAVRARLRPGSMAVGDIDYRKPSSAQPRLSASGGRPQEKVLEQFEHEPGAFLFQGPGGGSTPAADDRGASRTDDAQGGQKVRDRMFGRRRDANVVSFESNVLELAPGRILNVMNHPHHGSGGGLLVTHAKLEGEHNSAWRVVVDSAPVAAPYRPDQATPKPLARGLESATVVGASADDIHTDEYGRVRVHFHWDRESGRNDQSSCWLPTNQPWAGQGYGGVNLPRVGQEVLVEFMGGDPDRPVVVARVYTETNPVPDALPKFKRVSGLFSESTPRLVMGGAAGTSPAPAKGYFEGGEPFSQDAINSYATSFSPTQVQNPTGTNHSWKGSGFKLDDTSGAENLYIQANKDMHWVIDNNWTTVVGAHRSATIGTDDIISVNQNQNIFIGSDQETRVQKNQGTMIFKKRKDRVDDSFKQEVDKTIKIQSRDSSLTIYADDAIKYDSDVTIELRVKSSLLKIQKDLIVGGSGNDTFAINPGQDASPSANSTAPKPASQGGGSSGGGAPGGFSGGGGSFGGGGGGGAW